MYKNIFLIIVSLLFFIAPTNSHADKPIECQGYDHRHWTMCYGVLRAGLSGTYFGEFLNGKRHGRGIEISFDGIRKEGIWKNGELIKLLDR